MRCAGLHNHTSHVAVDLLLSQLLWYLHPAHECPLPYQLSSHTTCPHRSSGGVSGEDFDKFLASVQARTTALSSKYGKPAFALSEASDSESEEVDFGFWEKASDEDEKTPVAVVS